MTNPTHLKNSDQEPITAAEHAHRDLIDGVEVSAGGGSCIRVGADTPSLVASLGVGTSETSSTEKVADPSSPLTLPQDGKAAVDDVQGLDFAPHGAFTGLHGDHLSTPGKDVSRSSRNVSTEPGNVQRRISSEKEISQEQGDSITLDQPRENAPTTTGDGDTHPSKTNPASNQSTWTFADAVKNANAANGKAKIETVFARPSREKLLKLIEMADDDTCDDDAMLEAMDDAIPYPQKTAVTHFWVETGSDLAAQSNDKIISSIFSENDSATWSKILPDFVQVNKTRGGDLVIHVATESAKTAMSEQKITIFGNQYGVAPPRAPRSSRGGGFQGPSNSIHDHYFIDIIGIPSNFDSKKLIRLLRRFKTSPIFQGYKTTVRGGACHGNIWRVYFRASDMPVPLTINRHPVDQIKLDDIYYAVFAKNYVKSSVARENNRSAHCLDLDWIEESAQGPPEANGDSNTTNMKKAKTGKVIDLSEVNPGTNELQNEQESVEQPLQDDPMGALFDSSKTNNNLIQNEPPSEQARASNSFLKPKKTSKRKQEDLAKSWASDNLVDHLRDLQLKTLLVKFSDPQRQAYHVTIGDIPHLTSSDLSTSIKRTQTKDGRLDWHPDNLSLKEIVDLLAQHAVQSDDLVDNVTRRERYAAIPFAEPLEAWLNEGKIDELWQWASVNTLTANFHITDLNTTKPAAFQTFVRLHTWHRWISATTAPEAMSFAEGFKHVFGCLPTVEDLNNFPMDAAFAETLELPEGLSFLGVEDALSALEVWLSLQARDMLDKDAWLISITKRPVIPLPTHAGSRLFSADTLWNVYTQHLAMS
ncbi:hypothetical protein AC1031_001173 [Aphanomyces cochlioides]|nr:hypothetical protein AC1031_001173 [Aphanomyces cochlioides]